MTESFISLVQIRAGKQPSACNGQVDAKQRENLPACGNEPLLFWVILGDDDDDDDGRHYCVEIYLKYQRNYIDLDISKYLN